MHFYKTIYFKFYFYVQKMKYFMQKCNNFEYVYLFKYYQYVLDEWNMGENKVKLNAKSLYKLRIVYMYTFKLLTI